MKQSDDLHPLLLLVASAKTSAKTKPEAATAATAAAAAASNLHTYQQAAPQTSGFMYLSQMLHNRVQQAVRSYHQKSTCRIFQYVTAFRFLSPIAPSEY